MTDFNMRNILKNFNSVGKKKINESAIAECSMDTPTVSKTPMSVNITGDAGDISNMLRMLSGMEAKVGGMPAALMASPMDDPDIPGRDDVEGDDDMRDGIVGTAAGGAIGALAGGPVGAELGGVIGNELTKDGKETESFVNEPDEEYADHKFMTKDLSGGINRQKTMYKPAAKGDNPMAVETIKDRLYNALSEKKAKPDFLDMDKDGNKKEPMKKAVADKKKKAPGGRGNVVEAEVQAPNHELSDLSRKASSIAQIIKRKINSGEQMDDRDYNQMAELGAVLSRVGASFGPKSMKDVMNHMIQYTNDRNDEGHDYPEFTVDRFKELISMAKSKGESMMGEISSDLAKRYTKNAKVDRDNTDQILKRDGSSNDWKTNQQLHKRNSLRTKGINRAAKRIDR
jgi:hypothetical protein